MANAVDRRGQTVLPETRPVLSVPHRRSTETLEFAKELLGNVSLSANHPGFDEEAVLISKVCRELDAVIEEQAE